MLIPQQILLLSTLIYYAAPGLLRSLLSSKSFHFDDVPYSSPPLRVDLLGDLHQRRG